jgi:hypothetical protein
MRTFFVTTCLLACRPFNLIEHPSGLTSMYFAEDVASDSNEHGWFRLGGYMLLMYSWAFLAACAAAVRLFPARVRSRDFAFIQSWTFLVASYKSDSFWFSMLPLVRAKLFAILPWVFQHELKIMQVPVAILIVLVYAGFLVQKWPWKYPCANVYDALLCAIFDLLLTTASLLIHVNDISRIDDMVVLFLLMFVVLVLARQHISSDDPWAGAGWAGPTHCSSRIRRHRLESSPGT